DDATTPPRLQRLSMAGIDPNRKGPSRPADVEPHVRDALSRGEIPTVNLAESLAIEYHTLLFHAAPTIGEPAIERLRDAAGEGVTKRVKIAAELLLTRFGPGGIDTIAGHTSDTVRGWAAMMVGTVPDLPLAQQLDRIRPFADDPHYGVREWAWMAVRPGIVESPLEAIGLLTPWVTHHQPNVRRFAVESTRPRGVWCAHIAELKSDPSPGLPLLEPLRNDGEKYVQDAVANWLNDAGKTNAKWVLNLTDRWLAESDTKATRRIVTRARRNL
ncbi:MAG: DNA alkylation repair protein, partial [Planctomycetota bacterium]